METYSLSPFHYDAETDFEIVINKKPKDIELKGNEVSIIRALGKYKVLNKRCIISCIRRMQPDNRHKDSYDDEINLLFKGGYIVKYQYPGRSSGRSNTVLYALSAKGLIYAKEKKIRVTLKSQDSTTTPILTTATALEIMTLNSWHTRVLECYGMQILTELYDSSARVAGDKNCIIPSCITMKTEAGCLFNEVTVLAIAFEKENTLRSEGAFLNKLLAVNSFLRKNNRAYKYAFIVVLVESFIEMERASVKIQSYAPLKRLQVYYAIDEYVNELSPLKWLYDVQNDAETGTTKYTMINLLQKRERDETV